MTNLNFRADLLPFLIATIGEWVGLYYWLHYLDRDNFILANVILWTGFLIERITVVLWVRTVYRPAEGLASPATSPGVIVLGLIAITLPELVIWAVWLALADGMGYLLAGGVLAVLMLAEHSFELGLVKRVSPLSFVTNPATLFFTAMEVFPPLAWLYFVRNEQVVLGGAVLLIGLAIEHIIEGATLKPQETAPA
ncbi:MAG: hypothetical protein V3U58_04825 [Thermodesulfobacteriota bacterium]